MSRDAELLAIDILYELTSRLTSLELLIKDALSDKLSDEETIKMIKGDVDTLETLLKMKTELREKKNDK